MSRGVKLVAIVWTLLLAGILYELHGINARADAASVAVYQSLLGVNKALAKANLPETDAQRRKRLADAVDQGVADTRFILERSLNPSPPVKPTPR